MRLDGFGVFVFFFCRGAIFEAPLLYKKHLAHSCLFVFSLGSSLFLAPKDLRPSRCFALFSFLHPWTFLEKSEPLEIATAFKSGSFAQEPLFVDHYS